MTPIRPSVAPTTPQPQGQTQDAAKLAAARAFFAAAMGSATAPAATAAPTAVMAPKTVAQTEQAKTDTPQKIARPGSLLDIRV